VWVVFVWVVLIVSRRVCVVVRFFVVGCDGLLMRVLRTGSRFLFVRVLRLSRWSIKCIGALDFRRERVSFKGFVC